MNLSKIWRSFATTLIFHFAFFFLLPVRFLLIHTNSSLNRTMVVRPMKSAEKCLTSFRLENIDFPHFHVRVRAQPGDERLLLSSIDVRELATEGNTPRQNKSARKASRNWCQPMSFSEEKNSLIFLTGKAFFPILGWINFLLFSNSCKKIHSSINFVSSHCE